MSRAGKSSRLIASKLIPSLGVSDIDRSVGFYRQFFGFELEDSYENEGRMSWCWLKSGGADLMLQQLSADQQITLNPAIGQSWVIYIRPGDLKATHALLKKAGFPVSDVAATAYGASEFFVTDPDGYELWVSVPSANGNGDDDEDEDEDDDDGKEDDEDEEEEEEEEWQVGRLGPRRPSSQN
jgi:catechol 2,3-dioxygenase-like lactoylglutathione lyase family enzyme